MTTPHTAPSGNTGRRLRVAAIALLFMSAVAGCSTVDSAGSGETATTTLPTTTTLPASTSGTSAENEPSGASELFTDPEGTYQLSIPATWQANHGVVVAEIELWLVEEPKENFAPNVNVLTQAAPGLSLEEYLDASVANAPALSADFELLGNGIIEGAEGQPLAMMEYRAGDLAYLGIFGMTSDGQAVVATLTAPATRFDEIHDAVLPYLLTLEPLPPVAN